MASSAKAEDRGPFQDLQAWRRQECARSTTSSSELGLRVEADLGTGKSGLLDEEAVASRAAAPRRPWPASVQAE